MHYKQESNYGCGLYSLANVLQDNEILTPRNIEASKDGNNLGQLNKWLWERDYDIWIGMLRYDNQNPIEIFDLKPDFDVDKQALWFPFMIVTTSTPSRNHMLGCRYMRDMSIIVHDSLLDKEIVFENFDLFEKHYKGRVLSYECFYTMKNETVVIINN